VIFFRPVVKSPNSLKKFKNQSYILLQRNCSFARRDAANDVRQAGHCFGGSARAGASVVRQPGVAQVVEQHLAQRGIRNFLCRLRRLKRKTRKKNHDNGLIFSECSKGGDGVAAEGAIPGRRRVDGDEHGRTRERTSSGGRDSGQPKCRQCNF
jgi:hypothetical protein